MASSPCYHPALQFEHLDCSHQPFIYHEQQHRQQQYRYDQPQLLSTACCPPPFKRIRTTYHELDNHHQQHGAEETTTTSFYSPLASSCPLLGNTGQEEVEEAFDLESELELLLHELSSNAAGSTSGSPPFFFTSSSPSPSPSSSPSSSFSSSSDEPAASLPLSPPFFTLEAPSAMSSPSSSSGASSPARASFSGPPASAQTAANVRVCLSHKPRGSGGSYVPLAPEQHIRVTKGKGKRLRLAVESDRQFEWGHLQLNLIDDATGASCNDHFTIWNHKSAIEDDEEAGSTRAEVEVTVNKLSPQLRFQVVIDASANDEEAAWTWRGHSTSFGTHNNGKDRSVRALKKQRKDALRAAAAAAARDRKLRNKARSTSRA